MIPPVPPPGRPAGWIEPVRRRIPPPTWTPFALAFGLMLLGLGVIASRVVLLVGVATAVLSAAAWVRELARELDER